MQRISQQSILQQHRSSGAQSPPLPPPPPPEDEHEAFGRPRTSGVMPIVPDEEDLPGWVPKNYIEKGNNNSTQQFNFNVSKYLNFFQLWLFMITMRIKMMS